LNNPQTPRKRSRLLRLPLTLIKVVLGVLAFLVFAMVALGGLLYLYRDEIKVAVVRELARQLRAETVIRGDIDLTIWRSFPDVSVDVYDIRLSLKPQDAKRLRFPIRKVVAMHRLSLRIDLLSFLQQHYTVHQIVLDKPSIYLARSVLGRWNYEEIFRGVSAPTQGGRNDTARFYFDLNDFEVRGGEILIEDPRTDLFVAADDVNIELVGRFREQNFTLGLKVGGHVDRIRQGKFTYLRDKDIDLKTEVDINRSKGLFALKTSKLEIAGLSVELSGDMQQRGKGKSSGLYYNLAFNSSDYDIRQFFGLLPGLYPDELKDLEADGLFALDGVYRGFSSSTSSPSFKLNFRVQNGKLSYRDDERNISDISLRGSYSYDPLDSKKSYFWLDTLSGRLGSEPFNGSFSYTDFHDPFLKLILKGRFDLDVLRSLSPTLAAGAQVKGWVEADIQARGRLADLTANRYSEAYATGALTCKGVTVSYPGLAMPVRDLNASVRINGNRLNVEYARCKIGESDLDLSGLADNYIGYFFERKGKLAARLKLTSRNLDFNQWIPMPDSTAKSKKQESESDTSSFLPDQFLDSGQDLLRDVRFTFETHVDRFQVFKVKGQNLSGGIQLVDGRLLLHNIRCNFFGGQVELESESGQGKAQVSIKVDNVDIHEAFATLPVVGQLALVGKSIYGQLSSTIRFTARYDSRYRVPPSSILAEGDVLIKQGKIMDFAPLNRTILFFKLDRFQNVVFSDLKTHFTVEDNRMYMDGLKIRGNGIELEFFGSHGFDNSLDYRLRLSLLKRKLRNKEQTDVENLVDAEPEDTNPILSVYVSITGTLDKPKFNLDKDGFKRDVRTGLNRERSVFREGFRQDADRTFGKQDRRTTEELIDEGTETTEPNPTRVSPPPSLSEDVELTPLPAKPKRKPKEELPVDE
jgi:hypothetical protein